MQEVQHAFTEFYEKVLPRITFLARRSGLPDPDEVIGQVGEQLWCEFPDKHRENEEAEAAGLPRPHNFWALAERITTHRIIDEKRRLGMTRRTRSGKDDAPEEDRDERRLGHGRDPRRWEVPLSAADDVATDDWDPAILFERKEEQEERLKEQRERRRAVLGEVCEQLAREEPDLAPAIRTFLDKIHDGEAARRLGISRFALYRLRRRAVRRLRDYFAQRGFEVPTSRPPTLTWVYAQAPK